MKRVIVIVTLLISFFTACREDVPFEPNFSIANAKKYVYTYGIVSPSEYYVFRENEYELIQSDAYAPYDSFFQEVITPFVNDFQIKEIEFISLTEVLLRIQDFDIDSIFEINLPYTIQQDVVTIGDEESGDGYIRLRSNSDFTSLSPFLCGYTYSYYDTFSRRREIASFDLSYCTTDDTQTLLDTIVAQNQRYLRVGDTILLNRPRVFLEIER